MIPGVSRFLSLWLLYSTNLIFSPTSSVGLLVHWFWSFLVYFLVYWFIGLLVGRSVGQVWFGSASVRLGLHPVTDTSAYAWRLLAQQSETGFGLGWFLDLSTEKKQENYMFS